MCVLGGGGGHSCEETSLAVEHYYGMVLEANPTHFSDVMSLAPGDALPTQHGQGFQKLWHLRATSIVMKRIPHHGPAHPKQSMLYLP